MFSSDFFIALVPLLAIAAKMSLIITLALVLNVVQKKLVRRAIEAMPEHVDDSDVRSKMIVAVIVKIITAIIFVIGTVMVLGVLEVDTTPLLATLGVVSLGLGFAVQDLIRDYLQGFFILWRIGTVLVTGLSSPEWRALSNR